MFQKKKDRDGQDYGMNALLGAGTRFEGRLTFEGTVRIDGVFTGEIDTPDTLIIGEGGKVTANVQAGTVVVMGTVEGDILAKETVHLHSPARVRGNIRTGSISIDEGAVFEGACSMEQARPNLTVVDGSERMPVRVEAAR